MPGYQQGLPPGARARLAEIRGSGAWGPALSTAEFAAIRSAGLEPVGEVVGAAVYNIGYSGGYYCPGSWGGSYWGATVSPYQATTQVSGGGGLASFGPLVQTMYEARRKANGRVSAEGAAPRGDRRGRRCLELRAFP